VTPGAAIFFLACLRWIRAEPGGGPKTRRGTAAASRNSLKHGLTAAAPLLGEAIRRIHTGQSVGALFNGR